MKNPFITTGYEGPEYFCDREKETEYITTLLKNGNNIALISPRRIGKTDLIRHCFAQKEIQSNYYVFVIDIYSTTTLNDFVNTLGKNILKELRSKGKTAWNHFVTQLKSLKSEISFDSNGQPSWNIGFGTIENPATTLEEIFSYLNSADKHCLIAIDEFQQISKYPDANNVEATLRTYIQQCTNANFVFSGSQRHIMDNMFNSASRPFYQSVTTINLSPIPLDKYKEFVRNNFEKSKRHIDEMVIEETYTRFRSTTAYMQRIMNLSFASTMEGETCTIETLDSTINTLLDFSSDTYESLLYQMPEKQKNVLFAIAKEQYAKNISSAEFVKKNNLLSASSVVSATKGLLDKDLITQDKNTYMVYDQFFVLWLKRKGII